MREAFHDDLHRLTARLIAFAELDRKLMSLASQALLAGDVGAAASVQGREAAVGRMQEDIELHAFRLLAQQQPVATDLRTVIAAVHMSADLERMGALAGHVAKIVQRAPDLAATSGCAPLLRSAAAAARTISDQTVRVLTDHDLAAAGLVEASDSVMDTVRTELFATALAPSWSHGTAAAIRVTQLARYYERYADHAVKVVRRVVFIETGRLPD